MRKLLLLIAFYALALNTLLAIPADPTPLKMLQADGSEITIIQHGDEFFHWATTLDGYKLMRNDQGIFEYAMPDKNNDLVPSGIHANNAEQRSNTELQFLAQLPASMPFSKNQINAQLNANQINRAKSAKGVFPTTGNRKLIMILANFNDTDTLYARQKFDDYMNTVGGVSGTGSFRDYYLEVSYGQLDVATTVTVWVTVPNPHDYYGSDENWGQFAYDAIVQADSLGIDFSEFDNDGDGNVDGIAIIHQGKGQEASGNTNDIWSHSWNLQYAGYSSSQRTFDGVKVGAYTIQPERYGSGMSTIGVMCHEFGHNLGAPDYYDTNYETGGTYPGTGSWDLMAGGSWNGIPSGSRPAHHNMYQKILYNWVTPVYLNDNQTISLNQASEFPEAYIVKTPDETEFFVLENRQKKGFDKSIPGHGMIIYHVDEDYIAQNSGSINAYEHQGMYPKAAGGLVNSASCPFPGTSGAYEFTDYSDPSAINWDDQLCEKPIVDILEKDSIITFTVLAKGIEEPLWNDYVAEINAITLNWQTNANTDSVLLVWSQNETISDPEFNTVYANNDTLAGGEKVLYFGASESTFLHENLIPGAGYNYKIFSYNNRFYSNGQMLTTFTQCVESYELPFEQGFEAFGGPKPGICWEVLKNTETDGGLNGANLIPVNDSVVSTSWQINRSDANEGAGAEFISNGIRSVIVPTAATDYNWLISPDIQLISGYADLNFMPWYMTTGYMGGKSNEFKVLIFANDTWNVLLDWSNNPNNLFSEMISLNLDNYAGQLVKIAFVYFGKESYPLALDEISISGGEGLRPYDVSFKITNHGEALENASVKLAETTLTTDSLGMVQFIDQASGVELNYEVSKENYHTKTGTITLTDANINLELDLWPVDITDKETANFNVFPNPVKEQLFIETAGNNLIKYALYTLTGNMVNQGFAKNNQAIDLQNIENGLYYLVTTSANKTQTFKIVKQ
jgi:M6 family metalloprotease-like protein